LRQRKLSTLAERTPYIDELTGLQGRRSLNETLYNLGRKYAIAMIDVDHFKKFNDTYGHKTGDQVLKMIAYKLERISGGAKTFRYGGEE
jgi:diguanylate cyclase (GGDEF)-like protein